MLMNIFDCLKTNISILSVNFCECDSDYLQIMLSIFHPAQFSRRSLEFFLAEF